MSDGGRGPELCEEEEGEEGGGGRMEEVHHLFVITPLSGTLPLCGAYGGGLNLALCAHAHHRAIVFLCSCAALAYADVYMGSDAESTPEHSSVPPI